MALPKVFGLETEFGILVRGDQDPNPIAASSLLINAYVQERGAAAAGTTPVGWDFEEESPANDARGFSPAGARPPEVETHLVNTVLTNGARYYVDHAHPELSSPECADPLSVVRYDAAAELIVQQSMVAANRVLPEGQELVVYKNNSDRKGNSYGCHENYLVARSLPFGAIVAGVMPHFISRQIFTGAGKVGTEAPGLTSADVPYQLTQRADFFEEEVGLETTLKRPIVNTRDEPHADAKKYRRLHVIVGDANLSQVATLLKVGTTGLVLSMIEDGWLTRDLTYAAPVAALRQVSYDLTLARALPLADGTTATALEVQWEYLDRARKYAEEHGLDCIGGPDVGRMVLERWEAVLSALEVDPDQLADQVDWVAKRRLIGAYQERHDLAWDDARLAAMDLQYHDLRPTRSLAARVGLERLIDPQDALVATTEPPANTRAYFRGRCLARWPGSVVTANWDSLVFDVGGDPLQRVPMAEPLRGTEAHVGRLLEECDSAADLLQRLGS